MDLNKDFNVYTGNLTYREIEFTFVFDRNTLRLIPPLDKRNIIEYQWKRTEISPGTYVFADPISVDERFIIGNCNETGHAIIFLIQNLGTLSYINETIIMPLAAYIVCNRDREKIDRVTFSCAELNYIYPINQALEFSLKPDQFMHSGTASINLMEFDKSTSVDTFFKVDGKEIKVSFGISRKISTRISEPPLELQTTLMFAFEPTGDYPFLIRLWQIAKNFVSFLCYRRNIYISSIKLDSPTADHKHEGFATMYLVGETATIDDKAIKDRRYIKQQYIAGHEGEILGDIADGKLYLRHLPESYENGRHFNAARFVMITSAFEWEFRQMYPNGITKKQKTIQAEDEIETEIKEKIESSTGKKKQIYKFLSGLIRSDSLQSEIIQVGKDFDHIVGKFGEQLFHMNGEQLAYSEMGQRLAGQRNHFAHGDLDQEFIGTSLLVLIYLEYILYAMQLKHYGIDDVKIQKAINELFHLNFYIGD